MIKILVADDHALMREGIKQLIALEREMHVVAEASNGAEVLEAVRNTRFDLVLLDVSMPGINGIQLIDRINRLSDRPPMLVVSMHSDVHVVRNALNAGVQGYLTKDSSPETLLDAIRRVASGGRYLDTRLAEQLAFQTSAQGERAPHELLSAREMSVFRLLAKGRSLNEIAVELSISNKTVSTHKMRLMQKIMCRTNAEMIRYADTHGLFD
jgi:DNA-binding NarL/FixJ family response regulator